MWSTLGRYLIILFAAFLIISSRLAYFDAFYEWLSSGNASEDWQIGAFILGILIQFIHFPIRFELERRRKEKLLKTLSDNLELVAGYYRYELNKRFKCDGFKNANFRIFIPTSWIPQFIARLFNISMHLRHLQFHELAKIKITKSLNFQVYPQIKSQGLVGKSFVEECLNIKNGGYDPSDVEYNLYNDKMDETQKRIGNKYEFVVTAPIISSPLVKAFRKVEAIVSIDCKKSIPSFNQVSQEQAEKLFDTIEEIYTQIKPVIRKKR